MRRMTDSLFLRKETPLPPGKSEPARAKLTPARDPAPPSRASSLLQGIPPGWSAPFMLVSLWGLLQWFGGPATWGFDRSMITDDQPWRLLTAHLVHLNPTHLALNLLGLAGVLAVWGQDLRGVRLPVLFLISAATVSAGLWWTRPELLHYAGASGAVHGLFAAGIVLAHSAGTGLRLIAAALLLLKLGLEPHFGGGAAELIGAPVIHAAHPYGALGGGLTALLWRASPYWARR